MEKKPKKTRKKYECIKCNFITCNKKDYNRHLTTRKHQGITKNPKKPQKFMCECGRQYKFRSGLSKHKKICTYEEEDTAQLDSTMDIFQKVLEQQQDLQEKMKQVATNQAGNIINYNNNTNNKMTINLFLNEQCKDAINLTDFINGLEVSLEDLQYTKEHGYIKGISNIFVKHLQDMPPTERPFHCSDKKRMQFYVKDEDKWEKDNKHEKIESSITNIQMKQIKKIKEWEKSNPNYLKDEQLLGIWHDMIHKIMGPDDDITKSKTTETIKKNIGATAELKDAMIPV